MLQYISWPVFVASFCIGLLFVYILGPETKTVEVYPTPETVHKFLFRDKAENCFSYVEKRLQCPADESRITAAPVQS